MDHDRYGLDGMPIYPRPGHFDHVTGQPLPTFHGPTDHSSSTLVVPLAALMVLAGLALAYFASTVG